MIFLYMKSMHVQTSKRNKGLLILAEFGQQPLETKGCGFSWRQNVKGSELPQVHTRTMLCSMECKTLYYYSVYVHCYIILC